MRPSSRVWQADLPELPDDKKARFMSDYGLSDYDASMLSPRRLSPISSRRWPRGRDGKLAANWVINELLGRLNKEGLDHRRHARFLAAQLGGAHRYDQGRHDFRQDRQGPVRDRLGPRAATRQKSSRSAA
jgi:hypothetical protein